MPIKYLYSLRISYSSQFDYTSLWAGALDTTGVLSWENEKRVLDTALIRLTELRAEYILYHEYREQVELVRNMAEAIAISRKLLADIQNDLVHGNSTGRLGSIEKSIASLSEVANLSYATIVMIEDYFNRSIFPYIKSFRSKSVRTFNYTYMVVFREVSPIQTFLGDSALVLVVDEVLPYTQYDVYRKTYLSSDHLDHPQSAASEKYRNSHHTSVDESPFLSGQQHEHMIISRSLKV